jgi:hypothetical protein
MKYINFCAILFLACFIKPAFAQYGGAETTIGQSLSFGLEGNASFTKQFDGAYQYAPYQLGVGFVSRFEMPIQGSDINLTATTGLTAFFSDQTVRHFLGRKDAYTEQIYYFIPVKVGAKYYIGYNFYLEGEVGGIVNASNSFKTTISYAPGIGIAIPFQQTRALDLGIRYETYNQIDVYGEKFIKSFFSARLVYKFGIGVGQ